MGAEEESVSVRLNASEKETDTAASGASRMRSEANRVLKKCGPKIADKLGERAADGDLKSAEFLYKLCREEGEGGGPALTYSLAERLAAEPECCGAAATPGETGQDEAEGGRSRTDAAQAN